MLEVGVQGDNFVKPGGVPQTELTLRKRLVEQVRLRYRPKVRRLVRIKGVFKCGG